MSLSFHPWFHPFPPILEPVDFEIQRCLDDRYRAGAMRGRIGKYRILRKLLTSFDHDIFKILYFSYFSYGFGIVGVLGQIVSFNL